MSLNQRITLSAGIVLLIFITLITAALNSAYVESSETALKKQLTSQLYALMAAANVGDDGISLPSDELDTLLGLPSSGLYAFIIDGDNNTLWRSSSVLDADPPAPVSLDIGETRFYTISDSDSNFLIHAYGVNWLYEVEDQDKTIRLTFNVITDLADFNRQIADYRSTLWRWLLMMSAILIASQALILRWGLTPLRAVSKELAMIESGKQEQIMRTYPTEIRRLTDNINKLLRQERDQKLRYRNSLGDLAHSLKTPLAVIQSSIDKPGTEPDGAGSVQHQIDQMNDIVEYQLQRASTAGGGDSGKPIRISVLTARIVESLQKVYQEKGLTIETDIDDSLTINADEGDMMELFGNLIDNACKWASSVITIHHQDIDGHHVFIVSDDGPGIDTRMIDNIQRRGVRADQAIAGHGIGLAIVRDIIDAYDGELGIDKSPSGGARITVKL